MDACIRMVPGCGRMDSLRRTMTESQDTDLSLEEISQIFGEGVRQIVEGETKVSKVTKLGSSPADYEETQAENLRSLFLAMTEDYRVIFVKLADR